MVGTSIWRVPSSWRTVSRVCCLALYDSGIVTQLLGGGGKSKSSTGGQGAWGDRRELNISAFGLICDVPRHSLFIVVTGAADLHFHFDVS